MSHIKIISQYIKELQFNLPSAPQAFLNPRDKPNILISIDIDVQKIAEETFEVTLKIAADATNESDPLFNCKVAYCGLFSLQKIEGEMLEQILLIYCPNLLFPYLRRIMTNATSDAGLAPLMLDPIDFADLYNRRKTTANAIPINDTKN